MTRGLRWLWLLLPLLIAIGLLRLHFDVEALDLLPNDVPAVRGLKLYQQHFANARQLIMTVQAPGAEQAESAAQTIAENLRRQTNLVATVTWQPPWLEHPGQTAELIGYLWFNQPPQVFDQLTNRLAPGNLAPTLAAAREQLATSLSPDEVARLSYDPLGLTQLPENVSGTAPSFAQGRQLFSSADGAFRVVFVEANRSLATYRECFDWLQAVKKNVDAARVASRIPAEVRVNYTGRPAFVAEVAMGMEHDMKISAGGTSLIIAILFWLAHRRVKPMLWLLILLALILAGTLALGGLIFGAINVISMGFAAILLGLAVDYAVVHYQEALAHPALSVPEIRHAIAPSIFWAAVTTISAFLVLNLGGLPGLGQLGTLVGVGVALSACVMIFAFLPPLFPDRRRPKHPFLHVSLLETIFRSPDGTVAVRKFAPDYHVRARIVFAVTTAVILFSAITLLFGLPKMDSTANALRPRRSPAYAALDMIQRQLNQQREPLWLLVAGRNESEVAQRLDQVQPVLDQAVSNHVLAGFTLPTALWPRPGFQSANRAVARQLAGERGVIRTVILTNGFTETSLGLTEGILETWQRAASTSGVFWPTNELSRWIFENLAARSPTNCYALGLLYPDASGSEFGVSSLQKQLESGKPKLENQNSKTNTENQAWLSGWELLGHSILARVMSNLWKLILPMVCLVLLSLWLAFRRATEILLSLAILFLSGVVLLAIMRLAGWSWNLLNLMGLPLILGTGVDYSIFMQLALRRHHGDLQIAHRSVGRALLLCGGTAVAGFGALTFSSNAGMASLGRVCAVGIASNMLISIFLLPSWWQTLLGRESKLAHDEPKTGT